MIYASFNDTDKTITLSGLTQWDYGQQLKISGLKIAQDHIQVHFARESGCEALIVMGQVDDCGDVLVDIPNVLLKCRGRLLAYVYLDDGRQGETIRTIRLDVKARPKPQDYSAPDEKHFIEQLYSEVKGKADGLVLENGTLQLVAGDKPIGEAVTLPEGGGEMTPMTEEEIDTMLSRKEV